MSKFVIECPSCGRYAEANGGLLDFRENNFELSEVGL